MIKVKTEAGTICAVENADPGAPGIWLYFIPNGTDVMLDLACVEVKSNPDYRNNEESGMDLFMYVYGDIYTEEYTQKISYKRKDVLKMCDENEIEIRKES